MKKISILFAAIVFAVGCGNGYDSVNAQEFAEAMQELLQIEQLVLREQPL